MMLGGHWILYAAPGLGLTSAFVNEADFIERLTAAAVAQ
jgi:hypothetical protein